MNLRNLFLGFGIASIALTPSISLSQQTTPFGTGDKTLLREPQYSQELPSDTDWKSFQNEPPYSTILKVKSNFDGSVDYVVFDKDWFNNGNGTETGIRTKWSADKLEGAIYIKAGCGLLFCPFGNVSDIRSLPSPIVINSGGQEFRIYGEDGEFSLPSSFIKSVANGAGSLTVKLSDSGKVLTIGGGTVDALKKLYAVISTKEEPPAFKLIPQQVVSADTFQKQVSQSLTKIVGIKSSRGNGTGFVADKEGTVFTNRHVVGSARKVEVTYSDETKKEGEVVYRDRDLDLAIIKVVTPPKISPLPLCYAVYPNPAEEVTVLGNPLGLANTVTRGIVSAVRRSDDSLKSVSPEGTTLIQTDAAVNPGNSGGPMLNDKGEVLGIVSFKKSSGEGAGFAISIVDVLQNLKVKKPAAITNAVMTPCGNILSLTPEKKNKK